MSAVGDARKRHAEDSAPDPAPQIDAQRVTLDPDDPTDVARLAKAAPFAPHAFDPSHEGSTCKAVRYYPEYETCGKGPKSKVHDGTRPEPPELEFPYPPCSLCGEDTYHDGDSFRCDPCGACWGQTGPGSWMEPDLPVCGATRKPFDRDDLEAKYDGIRHHKDYCVREADHDGPHRANAWSAWSER